MKSSNLSKAFKIAFGFAVTFAAGWLFVRSTDWDAAWLALRGVGVLPVAACSGLTVLSLVFRTLRLKALLPVQPGSNKKGLFGIVASSFMLNNILPARLGEAARVFLLYRNNRYTFHVALGSLFAERVLDTLCYALAMLVPAVLFWPFLKNAGLFDGAVPVRALVRIVGTGFGLGVCGLLFYGFFPKTVSGIANVLSSRLKGRAGGVFKHLDTLVSGSFAWLFSGGTLFRTIFWSPASVFCYGFIIYLLASGMGLNLSLPAAFFASGILAFGVAVPSSPGYVGTLHLALREALVIFGIDRDSASALAVLYHLVTWSTIVITGLFTYFRLDFSLSEIRNGVKHTPVKE